MWHGGLTYASKCSRGLSLAVASMSKRSDGGGPGCGWHMQCLTGCVAAGIEFLFVDAISLRRDAIA